MQQGSPSPPNLVMVVRNYISSIIKYHQGLKGVILDSYTTGIFSLAISQTQVLGDDVCLIEKITNLPTGRVDYLSGIFFVRANQENLLRISDELRKPKPRFKEYFLYFSNTVTEEQLRLLAESDRKGVVSSVMEIHADYLPLTRNLFSLDIPSTLSLIKKIQKWSLYDQLILKRIVDGIYTYLVSTRRFPVFRYPKNSEPSYRLIDRLRQKILNDGGYLAKMSGGVNPGSVLLILDRRDDPITPLLNQFTYQAMLHELIGITRNRVEIFKSSGEESKQNEFVVAEEIDPFYAQNIYAFLSDVAMNVKTIVDQYKEKAKLQRNIESLEQMQQVIEEYPQFAKEANVVTKHVNLMGDMNRKIKQRNLAEISELEQDIVTGDHRTDHFHRIKKYIEDPKINNYEKLRLVLLYNLRYENDPNASLLRSSLETAGINVKDIVLIESLLQYAGKMQRGIDIFKSGFLAKAKGVLKSVFKDVDNVYTRHQSVMSGILDQLLKGKLKEQEFPSIALGQSYYNAKEKPAEVAVFYLGGATYQESREVQNFNEYGHSVQLGGSFIHNSKTQEEDQFSFLAQVSQMSQGFFGRDLSASSSSFGESQKSKADSRQKISSELIIIFNKMLPSSYLSDQEFYNLLYEYSQRQSPFPAPTPSDILFAPMDPPFIPAAPSSESNQLSQSQFSQKMEQRPMILCPICGKPTEANDANKCEKCLQNEIDLSKYIEKSVILHHCRQCQRFLKPPWTVAPLQSQQLLHICLKKIKGLQAVKLIDAGFVWTEPHSKRLKVKITVQKEAPGGMNINQSLIVEFVLHNQQCDDCKKVYTPHTWTALVQVRQKVPHKRTFLFLEQILLKHKAHQKCINIKEINEGLDFFFKNKAHANAFQHYIMNQVPSRAYQSKKLISHNQQNNEYNYKYNVSIDIAPICKDDLVCVPPKLSRELGGTYPILLCIKVTKMIHLLDFKTMQVHEIDYSTCSTYDLQPLCSREHLTSFIILQIQEGSRRRCDYTLSAHSSRIVQKQRLEFVNVEVMRENDMGLTNNTFLLESHLGDNLRENDSVLGYDLNNLNLNSEVLEEQWVQQKGFEMPEIILVKKYYPKRRKKDNKGFRYWKLKRLPIEGQQEQTKKKQKKEAKTQENQYEEFLNEIEEDPDLRQNIQLFRDEDQIEALTKQFGEMDLQEAAPKAEETKTEFKTVRVQGKERKVLVLGKKEEKKLTEEEERLKKEKIALEKFEEKLKQKSKAEGDEIEEDFPVIELTELMADLKLDTQQDANI